MNRITYVEGNIFNSSANLLVNPVNLAGVMGAGLALEFKKRFPVNFRVYRSFCNNKDWLNVTCCYYENGVTVFNLPTKYHWRDNSSQALIEKGLTELVSYVNLNKEIKSIAIPALGTGLGNLSWQEIRTILEKRLVEIREDVVITVYLPH